MGLTPRPHYSGADEHHTQTVELDPTADPQLTPQRTRPADVSGESIADHRCKTTIRERMTCGR
ncbi:hypothetical protein TPA0910_22950 [Streptomyces hygroscopicus subsp. sporocinereus]|uniref:Uncharacterized protein n=1 Tax=Streptomyces hygroscopicus TaxID=1912 RepID=A0ABQ3TX10_STRHY|nr:hypothetical protein TPA0910_22950 [Streptomyces hygroscopicus]